MRLAILVLALRLASILVPAADGSWNLKPVVEVNLGTHLGQLRAAPLQLGEGHARAFLVAYGEDFDIDPWEEMLFIPQGTLKIAAVTAEARVLWTRDLGRGVLPGIWFCPVFPFDLDRDGVDEIWFVDNVDPVHPFSIRGRRLGRLNGRTGELMGHFSWPSLGTPETMSHTYRYFILGGLVHGQPVLVTAQGTYGQMRLQAWNSDMSRRWEHVIAASSAGARGSHMTPVVDLDQDGIEEVLWGERLIELDRGTEVFCADRDQYRGHSDVIQPFVGAGNSSWRLFTCRESDAQARPRVVAFGSKGERLWGDLDSGHIDMGWVARRETDGTKIAMAIRITAKSLDPTGRHHQGVEEFVYDPETGKRLELPFPVYRTLPVDLDGDGRHELVKGLPGGDGSVLDWTGRVLAQPGGTLAMASQFLDLPGEQILMFYPNGTIRVWAVNGASDPPTAKARYRHPFYRANQRLTATGYNLPNLGGL